MTRWGSPARGAPAQESVVGERPEGRALALGRSVSAPIVLAVTTVAALAGAVLALLPAAVRRRPEGRRGPRFEPRADDGLARLTRSDVGPPPDSASEPLAP